VASIQLEHDRPQASAISRADSSLAVTVTGETAASPEQVVAAARDFSASRAEIWPNVEAKRLEVHEHGHTWAEVTEGTMVSVCSGNAAAMTGPSPER
jgi:hypothetical protein